MSKVHVAASGAARASTGFGDFFRYHGWLAPGIRLFRHIGFTAKSLCIGAVFVAPLAVALVTLGLSTQRQVSAVDSERYGLSYARELLGLMEAAQARRLAAVIGDKDLPVTQGRVDKAWARVQAEQAEHGAAFGLDEPFKTLRERHAALVSDPVAAQPDATFKTHNTYLDALFVLLREVSDGSTLAYDPERDTFHMASMSVLRGPMQNENTARLRDLGTLALRTGTVEHGRRDEIHSRVAVQRFLDDDVENAYAEGIEAFPEVAAGFDMKGADEASARFNEAVKTQLLGATPQGDAAAFMGLGQQATVSQHRLNMQVLERLDSQLQARGSRLKSMMLAQLGLAGFCIALAAYLMLAFYKVMMGGLQEVAGHLREIAGGNLTTQPRPWGRDEAAQLMLILADMQASLRRLVGAVREGASQVQTASHEIASASQDLSQRTERSAASLQQTSASMEQIAHALKESASTVSDAARQVDRNSDAATRGGQAIGDVVQTMDGIRAASSRIGEIIGVIDGIAFQTNILALNAAVEAARAGEHGRGFAVVASEVRALAARSASAAKEIKSLIGTSIERVESGSTVVANAGSLIRAVVGQADEIARLMREINQSATAQTQSVGEVTSAVRELDQTTQQNAALVEQTAAASNALADQAKRLNDEVSNFRLA